MHELDTLPDTFDDVRDLTNDVLGKPNGPNVSEPARTCIFELLKRQKGLNPSTWDTDFRTAAMIADSLGQLQTALGRDRACELVGLAEGKLRLANACLARITPEFAQSVLSEFTLDELNHAHSFIERARLRPPPYNPQRSVIYIAFDLTRESASPVSIRVKKCLARLLLDARVRSPDRWWRDYSPMCELLTQLKVAHLFVSPSELRQLMEIGGPRLRVLMRLESHISEHDSVRLLESHTESHLRVAHSVLVAALARTSGSRRAITRRSDRRHVQSANHRTSVDRNGKD